MPLKLAIVTPEAEALAVDCDEVIVPAAKGEMGILPGHTAVIATLQPGVMSVRRDNRAQLFVVTDGYVEVDQDKVSVLTDSCEPADQVDVERARKSKAQAEEQLGKLGPEDPGYTEAHLRLRRANARLDGAARAQGRER